MAHVRKVSPLVFLAISLKETIQPAFGYAASFMDSISTAQIQARKLETLNNLTDVELANQYQINRDQIPAYIVNGFRA